MLRPVKIIIAGVDNFSKTFEKASGNLKKVGAGMQTVGGAMSAGITLPIVGAGLAAMKFSTDLNAAMANVQSLGLTSQRTDELKKSVQGLSDETGMASVTISQGLYDMVSAFGDSADTAKLLSINVKAASAGLSSVQEAIALTSSVTKGYGDTSATAVQQVSDLAFQTVKLGQTTFPQLAASMGQVVPLASAIGVSQQELFSVFATATGVTGNAAAVSTQFRGVLQSLLAPSAQMTQLMEAYNIKSGKAMIAQMGLAGAVKFITSKAKEANVPLQGLIGSIEGQTIAMALSEGQAKTWADKMAQMKSVAGTTDQAFKDQTQGINKVGFAFKQMQARLVTLAENFGDRLAPAVMGLIDIITPLINVFSNLSPEAMTLIAVVGGVVAAIGPLLLIGAQLIGAFTTISTAVGAAGGMMAILSNPIGWVIGAIGLLAVAVTFIVTHWESKWAKLMAVIFPLAGIVALIIRNWSKIAPLAKAVFAPLILLFMGIWWVAKKVFGGIASFVGMVLDPIDKWITNVLDMLLKLVNMAMPDWVKEKIGFNIEQTTTAGNVADAANKTTNGNSEFQGTLTIKGAPKGSSLKVEKGAMDTELDSGNIMAGY